MSTLCDTSSKSGDTPCPDVSLFLRNLRLLDLDLLPDWPDITVQTFCDARDARVQQKSRLYNAEWVLFRLIEIWDANEASNVSQPKQPESGILFDYS